MQSKGPIDPEVYRKRTEEIEAKKIERQRERELKKQEKDAKKRRELIERLIAPILLILTALVSYILHILST